LRVEFRVNYSGMEENGLRQGLDLGLALLHNAPLLQTTLLHRALVLFLERVESYSLERVESYSLERVESYSLERVESYSLKG